MTEYKRLENFSPDEVKLIYSDEGTETAARAELRARSEACQRRRIWEAQDIRHRQNIANQAAQVRLDGTYPKRKDSTPKTEPLLSLATELAVWPDELRSWMTARGYSYSYLDDEGVLAARQHFLSLPRQKHGDSLK